MKIAPAVMAALESATASPAGIVLTGHMERHSYAAVDKVLKAAGFKWDRRAKAHTHPTLDAAEALDTLLSTGEVVDLKKLYGAFDTTGYALARIIELAQVEAGMHALEPSAGTGNIVRELLKRGAMVWAIEIQPDRANSLHGLVPFVACKDFLEIEAKPIMDRVVMNPPFAGQKDLDHVLHALDCLKPGGRLVAIMASGVRYRGNAKTARFHAAIAAHSPQWEDLPAESFKASGTSVNTTILTLNKS